MPRAYSWEEGRLAVKEMTEQVVLGLVEQGFVAEGVTLYVGYQILSKEGLSSYHGPIKVNYYGRKVPPSVHGTGKLDGPTASLSRITEPVRERSLLRTSIALHKRFGKNSLVRGMNLLEAGTTRERNEQIGGHRK